MATWAIPLSIILKQQTKQLALCYCLDYSVSIETNHTSPTPRMQVPTIARLEKIRMEDNFLGETATAGILDTDR